MIKVAITNLNSTYTSRFIPNNLYKSVPMPCNVGNDVRSPGSKANPANVFAFWSPNAPLCKLR